MPYPANYSKSLSSVRPRSSQQFVQELKGINPEDKRVALRMLSVHLSLPALRFDDSGCGETHTRFTDPSCEACLACAKARFDKQAGESGRLSWFPCPAESVDVAAELKNMAPQINYLLSHMRSGCWDPDLAAREILFREKIFQHSFFRKLQDCEECAQVLELAVVEEEKQKCRAVRDLRNFLTGSVNSNELKMPRMQAFLE